MKRSAIKRDVKQSSDKYYYKTGDDVVEQHKNVSTSHDSGLIGHIPIGIV